MQGKLTTSTRAEVGNDDKSHSSVSWPVGRVEQDGFRWLEHELVEPLLHVRLAILDPTSQAFSCRFRFFYPN